MAHARRGRRARGCARHHRRRRRGVWGEREEGRGGALKKRPRCAAARTRAKSGLRGACERGELGAAAAAKGSNVTKKGGEGASLSMCA